MRYYIVACDLANGSTKYFDFSDGAHAYCVDSPRRAPAYDNESEARAAASNILRQGYCEKSSGSRIINARALYYDE